MRHALLPVMAGAGLAGAIMAMDRAIAAGEPTQHADAAAIFLQMASVFQSPRCLNCHTNTAFPRQDDDRHRHTMNVARGPQDHGTAGLHCSTCHQTANQTASGVPGAPDWHLAPLRMAWEGLTASQICRALSDPQRGNMRPDQLTAHFNTGLVRWAWEPGTDARGYARTPPPLSRDELIALAKQWVADGAACPK